MEVSSFEGSVRDLRTYGLAHIRKALPGERVMDSLNRVHVGLENGALVR